ncbi:hypothetical protein DRN97_05585 [Methanosarcinales archaeon]|nr:MAG: hypothetical protein DRN97_05585 [Methanosarcinales archaeon]
MTNKEKLKKVLYGGIYPFFWCDTIFVEKLCRVLDELGLRTIVIESPSLIDALLTEEEAGEILRRLCS